MGGRAGADRALLRLARTDSSGADSNDGEPARRLPRPAFGYAQGLKGKPRTIDEYLAALSQDKRSALEKLRRTIRAAAPKAEECISYQLAAFRQDGMLVAIGATANHCAFYLMSSKILEAHQNELEGLDISKGTIRFQPDKPLPVALVRKLVQARIAENLARHGKTK